MITILYINTYIDYFYPVLATLIYNVIYNTASCYQRAVQGADPRHTVFTLRSTGAEPGPGSGDNGWVGSTGGFWLDVTIVSIMIIYNDNL